MQKAIEDFIFSFIEKRDPYAKDIPNCDVKLLCLKILELKAELDNNPEYDGIPWTKVDTWEMDENPLSPPKDHK